MLWQTGLSFGMHALRAIVDSSTELAAISSAFYQREIILRAAWVDQHSKRGLQSFVSFFVLGMVKSKVHSTWSQPKTFRTILNKWNWTFFGFLFNMPPMPTQQTNTLEGAYIRTVTRKQEDVSHTHDCKILRGVPLRPIYALILSTSCVYCTRDNYAVQLLHASACNRCSLSGRSDPRGQTGH